jgi:RNA polymerase sigma-70 factor (TIGR02960 family)
VSDLLGRAREGDEAAFEALVAPHRRELHVHCYRFLGSAQDADDALQETLIAAWRGLSGFAERSSMRTWLYAIATRRCLNQLRSRRRQVSVVAGGPMFEGALPAPTGTGEVAWLEPYADEVIDAFAASTPGPEAEIEAREAISLAFIAALQKIPPRQRAVLVLRDVLGYRASEVAEMLEVTEETVTSLLKRARAQRPVFADDAPIAGSAAERAIVDRLVQAFEASDLETLLPLLAEDVRLTMPPTPLEYAGRDLARRFFEAVVFSPERRFRMFPTRANGQPALAAYTEDPLTGMLHANGLLVIDLVGERVSGLTRFESGVLSRFGFPRTVSGEMIETIPGGTGSGR